MAMDDVDSNSKIDIRYDKRRWFGNWGKRIGNHKQGKKKVVPQRSSLYIEEKKYYLKYIFYHLKLLSYHYQISKRSATSLANGYRSKVSIRKVHGLICGSLSSFSNSDRRATATARYSCKQGQGNSSSEGSSYNETPSWNISSQGCNSRCSYYPRPGYLC
ncbi:unnamed protein product [Musa acuminata subsp. malaccensis]|uniref:(wild Malaysian banana) hypothetical protein n=1 Tax=Musa acuminata subsp. malaccensis TaxID=214687 RepID=A0A804J4S2_MUSAM|nr:unnamed protein product [Musa acuminata subsp. malaccensis]